jgi:hypothetical protein
MLAVVTLLLKVWVEGRVEKKRDDPQISQTNAD